MDPVKAAAAKEETDKKRLEFQQKLIVAEMNDGTLYTASREVKVTIGGCGG